MFGYLVRSIALSVVSLLGVLLIIFLLIRVSGDPAMLMAGPDATPADLQAIRVDLGLGEPLPTQFVTFISHAARLDFGRSFHWRQPALTLVVERIWPTVQIAAGAMVVLLVLGLVLGTIAAVKRDSGVDVAVRLFALLGQAMPTYWLGLILILLFSVHFRVFPTSGTGTWQHVILPAITLGWFSTAATVRMLRSSLIEVLQQDYIRTARAKGLRESAVLVQHALRNALIPAVTLVGLQVSVLLGGSALVETVFAVPGVGLLAVQAVSSRDYPVVQTVVFLTSCTLIGCNLLVDLTYAVLDPRIRVGGRGQ